VCMYVYTVNVYCGWCGYMCACVRAWMWVCKHMWERACVLTDRWCNYCINRTSNTGVLHRCLSGELWKNPLTRLTPGGSFSSFVAGLEKQPKQSRGAIWAIELHRIPVAAVSRPTTTDSKVAIYVSLLISRIWGGSLSTKMFLVWLQ